MSRFTGDGLLYVLLVILAVLAILYLLGIRFHTDLLIFRQLTGR